MIKKNKIKIRLNGKFTYQKPNISLNDLIKKLKIPVNKVAIELNNEIINKKKIKHIKFKENDNIEIVHFIGGG
tara:strand:+ start:303 stop:521 length:219 start_codon:yes stop_codon:yes gene_type:complete